MLQTVQDRQVYVVDFDTMPPLPITWSNAEEEPYARCLDNALRTEVITEPGKYGIELQFDSETKKYMIYKIIE